jgi:hypothetical protein
VRARIAVAELDRKPPMPLTSATSAPSTCRSPRSWRKLTVRRDGVYGFEFTPRNPRAHPAVLVFGGSEGGDSMVDAAGLLAAHGYTTLALAYFRQARPAVRPRERPAGVLRTRVAHPAPGAARRPAACGDHGGADLSPRRPRPRHRVPLRRRALDQDDFGGSARADAAANADLWPRILRLIGGEP